MQAWKEENHSLECLSLFIVKATTLPQWHIFWPQIATEQLLHKKNQLEIVELVNLYYVGNRNNDSK